MSIRKLTLLPFFITVFLFGLPVHAEGITPFTAQYEFYYKWFHLGSGEYVLKHLSNENYEFHFASKMRFLLYSDKRNVQSNFAYQDNQLLSVKYTHERTGTGRNYEESILFEPEANQIDAHFRKQSYTVPYDALIKDGLSVQLQLMLDIQRGEQQFKYRIFEAFGVMQREFTYLGSANVTIEDVSYDCILIEVKRPEKRFKIQMWFAKDLGYQAVQLVLFSNEKKQFSAVLSKFSFQEKDVASD